MPSPGVKTDSVTNRKTIAEQVNKPANNVTPLARRNVSNLGKPVLDNRATSLLGNRAIKLAFRHHATLQTLAFLLLAVFLTPASTTMPRLTSSIRRGRAVLGFIANPAAISSSVAGP
jgi:hypothetical protein